MLLGTKGATSDTASPRSDSFRADSLRAVGFPLPPLPQLLPPYSQAPLPRPGPSCSWADPVSDAGTLIVQGPEFGPVSVPRGPTGRYALSLPTGTIRPGTFTVTSLGAGVVGTFA